MNPTICDLDERLYRRLRARALASGVTVGAAMNEAMRMYLAQPETEKTSGLQALVPEPYPDGNELLSEQIDMVVYST